MKKLINASFACKFRLQKNMFAFLLASENTLINSLLQDFSLQVSFAKNQTLFCACKEKCIEYQRNRRFFLCRFLSSHTFLQRNIFENEHIANYYLCNCISKYIFKV